MKKILLSICSALICLTSFSQAAIDVGIVSIDSLTSDCGLSSSEKVCVKIKNFGSNTISNFPVEISVNSATPINETVSASILPGDSLVYCFNTTLNLSVPGTYSLIANTLATGDANANNDSSYLSIIHIPIVNTYPYLENFENGNGGWISGGINSTWALGTPAATVINSNPVGRGVNSWVTNLTGNYNNDDASWVLGPCFDFSNLSFPQIKMEVWWSSEFSWDGAVLQYSIDAGTSWLDIGLFGDPNNWYTDSTINGLAGLGSTQHGWTGIGNNSSGGWVLAEHDLSSLGGFSSVLLRVAFGSDGSVQEEGFAFDNVLIQEAPSTDIAVVGISSPNSGCGLSNDSVTVCFSNVGTTNITNVPLNYTINGGSSVTDTAFVTIFPGDTLCFTFDSLANLSTVGTYTINVFSSVTGDGNLLNDSKSTNVTNIPILSTFPYFEDFENGSGGWISNGINNSWVLGTPSGSVINSSSGSGFNSWVTNLTGNYNNDEESYVIGPCFDFTNLAAPQIKMDVWWNAEFSWDGIVLQSSTDGGASWQNVGAYLDPNNWYTDNTIAGLANIAPAQEGWSGRNSTGNGSAGWVLAEHDLNGLGGISGVLLRVAFGSDGSVIDEGFAFDNVLIQDAPATDIAVLSISSPNSGCGLSSDSITVCYTNAGSANVTNVPFNYVINGGTPVTDTAFVTILPGDTLCFTFNTIANLSTPGTYNFDVYSTVVGDGSPLNDSISKAVENIPILTTFPYFEDFENGSGGWISNGTNNSWALGSPAATVINSSPSGFNSWVTNLTGNYNNDEESYVIGPCFDFTNLAAPQIKMDVWWNAEFSWDGIVLQSSTDGGASWQNVGAYLDPNNWYTDNTIAGLANIAPAQEGWSGRNSTGNGSAGWVLAEHDLNGLGGISGVLLRVAFGSDGSVIDEGFAFDNVLIQDAPANDMGAYLLSRPITGCGLSSADSVEVCIVNYGSQAASNFSVGFIFNSGTPVVETYTGTVNPGDTVCYTFTTTTVNMSTPGSYFFDIFVNLTGDANSLNDSLLGVEVRNTLKAFPYYEDFDALAVGETGQLTNDWIGANNGAFEWIANTGATTTTASGPIGDNTTGTGIYMYTEASVPAAQGETAWLTSPCIDLTNISGGLVSVVYRYHMYGADIQTLYVDIDSAGTWINVDTIVGQQQTASADPYLLKVVPLPQAFVLSNLAVRFRTVRGVSFDGDVAIDDVLIDFLQSELELENYASSIAAFPNPSNGLVTVTLPFINTNIDIQVMDVNGKLMDNLSMTQLNRSAYQLDMSNLAKGIYMINIKDAKSSVFKKIIIQ